MSLGRPRLHLRRTDSTNLQARRLALSGAPHGTLITADEQTVGRGRQGRSWVAPPGRALLCSLVLEDAPRLLSLAAGVAVADAVDRWAESPATLKWPNDVLLGERKVAGILVEGRPQAGWTVLGIGINVALGASDLPPELREQATGLGLKSGAVEAVLEALLGSLEAWLPADPAAVLEAVRARDALQGRGVSWSGGSGQAAGIDDDGRLVILTDRHRVALDAGEVHLHRPA